MTVAENIIERVRLLPEPLQAEVLDFVEFLANKADTEEREAWSRFSLAQAFRDMESEDCLYSEQDIKEPAND